MAETTAQPRADQTTPLRSGSRMRPKTLGRFVAWAVVILVVALASYSLGRHLRAVEIGQFSNEIAALHDQNAALTRQANNQAGQIAKLQSEIGSVQGKLSAILPSPGTTPDTYSIHANESVTIASGQLRIGLVGAPLQTSIDLNINGKQQSVASGDVINVATDPSTSCQVQVVSFDILQASAVVKATCTAVTR